MAWGNTVLYWLVPLAVMAGVFGALSLGLYVLDRHSQRARAERFTLPKTDSWIPNDD